MSENKSVNRLFLISIVIYVGASLGLSLLNLRFSVLAKTENRRFKIGRAHV